MYSTGTLTRKGWNSFCATKKIFCSSCDKYIFTPDLIDPIDDVHGRMKNYTVSQ